MNLPPNSVNDTASDDESDARTSPLGLFHYARSYSLSGRYLHNANLKLTHPHAPINFLFYHAIELYLKAHLRVRGFSVKKLRSVRHNVNNLVELATKQGLQISDEDKEITSHMVDDNAVIRSRYIETGFMRAPSQEALSEMCTRLDQAVGEALKAAGTAVRPMETLTPATSSRGSIEEAVEKYIPYMTDEEKKIIAFLLAKKQKTFTAAQDGGYAVTLISRGIVRRAMRPGQVADAEDVPMEIPDEVWDVLIKHQDQFPYDPPRHGETETHPWRIPWQLR